MRVLGIILLLSASAFAQATRPAADPDAIAALRAAREAATSRFLNSPAGKSLAENLHVAESRREEVRDNGTDEDRSAAAAAWIRARTEYNAALQTALEADPAVREASARVAAAPPAAKQVGREAGNADGDGRTINQRILAFAHQQLGQQVGNGECWTLANEALRAAGTKHPATYVWGRALAAGETVLPGDVIQFKSVRLQKGRSWETLGAPDHTAIIKQVQSRGVYVILHQNYGAPGRKVSELTIDMNTKSAGEFVIYRPGEK